jgi:rfaE bifunctional protein kinase chain/domain
MDELSAIQRLRTARVGVVGDLVADLYVSGLSDRVSREAPVLIVRYEDEWLRPGGAANVAANVAALGATACVVGLIGDDDAGRQLVRTLGETTGLGAVDCQHLVTTPGRATITKTRFLAGAKLTSRQQVLRVDREPAARPASSLHARLAEAVRQVDLTVDAWIVSDYGYGGVDENLRELLREIARRKPVVADSRYELHLFGGMTVLKPNEEEAEAAARTIGLACADEAELAARLEKHLQVNAVLVTLGNKGMVLSSQGRLIRIPAVGTEEIVDLTGAGDSVAATMATALAGGADLQTAARLANHAGAVVVMKEGAATASPEELSLSVQKDRVRG